MFLRAIIHTCLHILALVREWKWGNEITLFPRVISSLHFYVFTWRKENLFNVYLTLQWILQAHIHLREEEMEHLKTVATFVKRCSHSMARITKTACFTSLIYWVIWNETIKATWEQSDVIVAVQELFSFCYMQCTTTLEVAAGCSGLCFSLYISFYSLYQHWERRYKLNHVLEICSNSPDWSICLPLHTPKRYTNSKLKAVKCSKFWL